MTALDDSLTLALRAAPELQTAPSVALGIAQDATQTGADPTVNGQVVAQVNNQQAAQQAVGQVAQKSGGSPDLVHQTLGWFGRNVVHPVAEAAGAVNDATGGVLGKGLNMLGAPLREVQHDYRAVHDIEARHGPIAGLLAGLGIGVGAAVGTLVDPGEGSMLGGELAGEAIARLSGSYGRTTSGAQYQGTYNRQTGQYEGPAGQVSIGRDIAGSFLKPGSAPYEAASGATDFIADVSLDPLAKVGKAFAASRSAEGAGGAIGTTFSHAPQGDTFALRAQDLEQRVANLPSVDRAFNHLAGSSSADIIKNWPKLSPLADQLGAASTKDQVVDVFRNALMSNEMTSATLPSMSMTRVPFAAVSRAFQDYGGPGEGAIRSVTSLLPTYFDKATLELSNKGFSLGDPEATQGIYRVMRYTQSRDVAAAVAADFAANMANPDQQILIYKNGIRAMLEAKGLGDTQYVEDTLDELTQRAMGGGEAFYGVAQDGGDLSKVDTITGKKSLGLLQSQAGKLAFPDFNAVTAAVRDLNIWKSYYGSADEWMYDKFTQGVFKRLVLLSGGFAQRIAMAETIPAMLRNGPLSILRSRLSASTAKAFADNPDEEFATVSAAARALGGIDKLVGDADKTEFAVNLIHDNGGGVVAPAISTTTPSATVTSPVERASRNIYNAYVKIPDKMKLGDEFGTFLRAGTPRAQYLDAWQRSLSSISNDPASQKAAAAYLDVMRGEQKVVPEGFVRLYRGQPTGATLPQNVPDWMQSTQGAWFTPDRAMASRYGDIRFVDVPQDVADATRRAGPIAEHILPNVWAERAMPAVPTAEDATTAGWQAAKEWWDGQPAAVQVQHARHAADLVSGMDPHEAWARDIMENVKGATHAPLDMGGAAHPELLQNVAEGTITPEETLHAIPDEMRPLAVVGRQLLPDTTGTIERIANVGFKKVLDPVINFISREPAYLDEAYRQYQYLKPLVDSGDMLADDARQLAQVRGVNGVLPFIHNTLERSQFSQLARNFMPFWFAQEQSYKRFGRLLADDPGAFRQFQLMISGLHEVGSSQQDPNGKSWLVYPGAGFLSEGTVKLLGGMGVPVVGSIPTSFSGQLKSLNTIFPFSEGVRPSFGPVVAIPAHLIENLFPELTPAVHTLIGDQAASGSIYDQLIPNQTIKGVVQALDPSVRSRSMQNAMNNALQYVDYRNRQMQDKWVAEGKDPADPAMPHIPGSMGNDSLMDRQTFLADIKNQTRVTFMFKALLGAVTPTAPVTNVGDWNLRTEWRDLINQKGVVAAHDEFLTKHPGATAYTVAASDSQAGAPIPANLQGQQWINANLDLLRRYPNAAAWFVPQFAGAQFSQGVYNEQQAQHLRAHKDLTQMQKDLWIAAGNDQFYGRDLPTYKAALLSAQQSGNRQQASFLRTDFNNYVTNTLGPQNPVWWDDLSSADRDHQRQLAVQQMRDMFAKGDVPASPMTDGLKGLMQDYETYTQAKLDTKTDPNITAAGMKTDWQAYLDNLAVQEPTLAPVIRSVFRQV